jgi:hypothetical protein
MPVVRYTGAAPLQYDAVLGRSWSVGEFATVDASTLAALVASGPFIDDSAAFASPAGVGTGGISRLDTAPDYAANLTAPLAAKLNASAVGAVGGVAPLGGDQKVPLANLTGKLAMSDLTDGATQLAAILAAIKTPTAWAASIGGGTPTLTSGTAVLGTAYKNTTSSPITFTTPIDGIAQVAQGDLLVCLTAGTYTYFPAGGAYLGVFPTVLSLPTASSNTANFALVNTTFFQSNGTAWVAMGGGIATVSATWSTMWDTSGAKDFGDFTKAGSLDLTSSDLNSIVGGFSRGTIISDGGVAPTFDGAAHPNWNNAVGARNPVTLSRTGNSKAWNIPPNFLGAAIVTPVAANITSAPVLDPVSAGATVTWTPGSVTGTPAPTVSFSLKKNGTVVASPATSGVYGTITAGDNFIVTQAATNAAYGGGTATPVDSAQVTATAPAGVTVTITTQLDANRIIQRTSTTGGGQGKGQASVPMALSFTGTQPIYCRRRSTDGTTILQAPWLANASATTGTVTLSGIDVPAINAAGTGPVNTGDGWFFLDVATASGGPWTNGTSQVTAGRLVMISGQSLAVRMICHQEDTTNTNASLGITISPYASLLYTYNEARAYLPTISTMPWAPPADGGNYDGTFAAEFTRRQIQQFRCPTGIIGHARGAQPLRVFLVTTGNSGAEATTYLAPVIARAGGAFESCIWYQGHTEATYGTPAGGYATALGQLFTYFASLNSLGSFTKYVGTIPNINASNWGTPFARRWIRQGAEQWATGGGGVHVPINDLAQADGIHQNQIGNLVMAQHFARATRAESSLRGDAGPAFVSASRSGQVITATFSDVGQGTLVLTGTPGDRIYVFPKGRYDTRTTSNNRFPVSSVSVTNKTTLSITLANDPGDAQALDIWFYWPNDLAAVSPSTSNIRDDITDGDGITVGRQIVPNNSRYTIAAPGSTTTNAPPSGLIAASSQFTMTETSTTYGSQEQTGFNGTLSGGYGISAGVWSTYYPLTVEFWFTAPSSAPSATQYIVGGIPNFISLRTDMKLGFGSITSTAMTAGHRYHFACQLTLTGHAIYMTDITAAGSGTLVGSDTTAASSSTVPAGTNLSIRYLNGTGNLTQAGATVDEVAIFDYLRYSGSSYTAPTAPFTGLEPGIVALYHLDADCKDSVGA